MERNRSSKSSQSERIERIEREPVKKYELSENKLIIFNNNVAIQMEIVRLFLHLII